MQRELFRPDGHEMSHTIDRMLENQSSVNPAFTAEPKRHGVTTKSTKAKPEQLWDPC